MNQRQRDQIVEDIAVFKTNQATRAYLEECYYQDITEELQQEDEAMLLILLKGNLDRDLEYYEALRDHTPTGRSS